MTDNEHHGNIPKDNGGMFEWSDETLEDRQPIEYEDKWGK